MKVSVETTKRCTHGRFINHHCSLCVDEFWTELRKRLRLR